LIELSPERIAELAEAEVIHRGEDSSPARAVVDSRTVSSDDLFVGLPGEHADGGEFAGAALESGAWGALAGAKWAKELAEGPGWVLSADDPLAALQRLARGRRRALGCEVVGITGSTGKTSVKDICRSLLGDRAHASPENYNTEIGLPLAILLAPPDTEVMVLEMGMRGRGQIGELCAIAEPNIAVITNVGPVHLELLETVEAIAAAKAEILVSLPAGGTAVIPADPGPLAPFLEGLSQRKITFGPRGDVRLREAGVQDGRVEALVASPDGEQSFSFPFTESHNVTNALAAIAVGVALGVPLPAMSDRAAKITFSRLRGELIELSDGAVLINDSYNANPMSMRAALDHLVSLGGGRTIAVLGEMAELGSGAEAYHREIGEHARAAGVDVLIGVGEPARAYGPDELVGGPSEAAALLAELLGPGDAVLVKGSRAVALEAVAEQLAGHAAGDA
jgi:UDP-N-acetylmuramoyl-tripeptide--D-alanyl-D-alanine ligase